MPLVVHPHLHPRRTGVTTHVETVTRAMGPEWEVRILGEAVDPALPRVSEREVLERGRTEPVIWHAHRNRELTRGLWLKARGADLRIVWTRHSAPAPGLWTRSLASRADARVSISSEVAANLGLPSTVIRHGVDLTRFAPPENRGTAWAELGVGGPRGLGVLGRVRPAKGQGDFAAAIAPRLRAHPGWRAVLVGAALGKDAAWANRLAEETPLTLVGAVNDPTPWYRGLTIVVQASHQEGLGLVPLEAMASGCCVVASRISDLPELLEDGVTGRLFEPGDVDGLGAVLDELMADPEAARAMGDRAAAWAREHLGAEHEAAALGELYREALGLPGTG